MDPEFGLFWIKWSYRELWFYYRLLKTVGFVTLKIFILGKPASKTVTLKTGIEAEGYFVKRDAFWTITCERNI